MKFLAGRASRRSTVKYLAEWGEKKGAINPADRGLCQIFLEINRDDATFHRLNYIWQTGERQRRERSYRKAASRLDFPSADSWQTPDTNGWETNVREYTQRDSDSARGGIEHSFQTICPFPRRMLPFASGSRSSMRWLPLQIEARSKPDFSLSLFPSFHFSTLSLFSQFYPLCQQRERERERENRVSNGRKIWRSFRCLATLLPSFCSISFPIPRTRYFLRSNFAFSSFLFFFPFFFFFLHRCILENARLAQRQVRQRGFRVGNLAERALFHMVAGNRTRGLFSLDGKRDGHGKRSAGAA